MTINFLAVFVIAIVLNVIGFLWYGKTLFGKSWMRVMGCDPATMTPEAIKASQKGMTGTYILNFLLSMLTVGILAWALGGESSVGVAVKTGFIIWLGFAMPMQASLALWSGKPKAIAREMFLVSAGYQLVAFVVAGWLLALWH